MVIIVSVHAHILAKGLDMVRVVNNLIKLPKLFSPSKHGNIHILGLEELSGHSYLKRTIVLYGQNL